MTPLTKHLQPRASFSELGLGQRGDAADVLQLVSQLHFLDGQRQLRARRAVHTEALGEGRVWLELLDGSILVVNPLPLAGPRHLFWAIDKIKRLNEDELDERRKRCCLFVC